jgi:enoyl-[acyl-carrier protein] reductase II
LLKKLSPIRLADNDFSRAIRQAEDNGFTPDQLRDILGKGRAKKGIFEGDLLEGELEIGQAAGSIRKEESVADVFSDLIG